MKRIPILIFKAVLGLDHYWQKISQSTLIIQKEMKNNHLTHLGINLSHYELEEDVVFCATCVSQEKKGNLKHCQKSRMYFFLEAASMLVI